MRNSPSFLPENTQVCVETDVNRAKEKGQSVMEGTQIRSAQQTATQATRQTPEQERKSSGSQASRLRAQWCQTPWGSIQELRGGCLSGVLQ